MCLIAQETRHLRFPFYVYILCYRELIFLVSTSMDLAKQHSMISEGPLVRYEAQYGAVIYL